MSISLLVSLALAVPAPTAVHMPAENRADTLRIVEVRRGDVLRVEVRSADVTIRTIARDEVRLQSDWSGSFTRSGTGVSVHSNAAQLRGREGSLLLEAPAWMPISVTTMQGDVNLAAGSGRVAVETLDGDIRVSGATGGTKLESVSGDIVLTDARGRMELESVNGSIRAQGAGEVVRAETVNGDITLSVAQSNDVSLTTVNGELRFAGPLDGAGNYRFITHNGDVTLHLPGTPNASLNVSTFNGDFESEFPLSMTLNGRSSKRFTAPLGRGAGARVEIESFQGNIALTRTPLRMPAPAND